MKKRICMLIAFLCYAMGIFASLYVGLWGMICRPLQELYTAFVSGDVSLFLVAACAIKILFSTTLAGMVWCIGYIGFNHFKGDKDPDWDAIEEQRSGSDS